MAKVNKTNAMRILDKNNINYNVITYEVTDGSIDGISVAIKINKNIFQVFKTLVTKTNNNEYKIFVIPVDSELDLKKAGYASKEKKIEMINMKDLLGITGYIRGGCSPIGMKKSFETFFHNSILNLEKIIVSGGKIGIQIEIDSKLIIQVVNGKVADLVKD